MMLSEKELSCLFETFIEHSFSDSTRALDAVKTGKTVLSYYKGKVMILRNNAGNIRLEKDHSSMDLNRMGYGSFLVLGGER